MIVGLMTSFRLLRQKKLVIIVCTLLPSVPFFPALARLRSFAVPRGQEWWTGGPGLICVCITMYVIHL
jgi:hypothetical protein